MFSAVKFQIISRVLTFWNFDCRNSTLNGCFALKVRLSVLSFLLHLLAASKYISSGVISKCEGNNNPKETPRYNYFWETHEKSDFEPSEDYFIKIDCKTSIDHIELKNWIQGFRKFRTTLQSHGRINIRFYGHFKQLFSAKEINIGFHTKRPGFVWS